MNIPIYKHVDILVVGGSSSAVAAAVSAARAGKKVFLIGAHPYLGEDLCAHYRLWLKPDAKLTTPLAKQLFEQRDETGYAPPTMMHIKYHLEEALLEAQVGFLLGAYPSAVLRDADGCIQGLQVSNRSGLQAIRASAIIDATERSLVARMAGVSFQPYEQGSYSFKRIVVGGEPSSQIKQSFLEKLPTPVVGPHRDRQVEYPAFEYTLNIEMADGSPRSFAKAEVEARKLAWHAEQVRCSDFIYQIPPDPVVPGENHLADLGAIEQLELATFSYEQNRLFLLNGCADVSRAVAEQILEPQNAIAWGDWMGKEVAAELDPITDVLQTYEVGHADAVACKEGSLAIAKNNLEMEKGLGFIVIDQAKLPVLGDFDVVVMGGGTGGAPAGIAAAQEGARTLVCEYLPGLGGVGTMGMIGKYWFGNRVGFTENMHAEVCQYVPNNDYDPADRSWNFEWKMDWYLRELREAGAQVWFGAIGCAAWVSEGRVEGVVVASPYGYGLVRAKVVVDATGNADIAAAAGAPCENIGAEHVAIQGTGLPPRRLKVQHCNTDYTFVDDSNVADSTHALITSREKFKHEYDLGQLIDTRQRQQIKGEYELSPLDILAERTFPDTIVRARSNFDSHGFTVHPVFMVKAPDHDALEADVPYRCLLPQKVENVLVTGLGMSAHRDALPVVRMQADVQNQGYAAGMAAAMIVEAKVTTRTLDIKQLQQKLVACGNLDSVVLNQKDSFPWDEDRFARAVTEQINDYLGIAMAMAFPEQSIPYLKKEYEQAQCASEKLQWAKLLGLLGDATGVSTLLEYVAEAEWDEGWNYTGLGQFGKSISELDGLIIALGKTGERKALPLLIEKLKELKPGCDFSHCRALGIALRSYQAVEAAPFVADLLRSEGMMGHHFCDIVSVRRSVPENHRDTTTRNASLRELHLARLLCDCGDFEGLGRSILVNYKGDLRGHYAKHARALLESYGSIPSRFVREELRS